MKTSLIFAITAVLTTVDACTYSTIGQTLVAARWITSEYLLVMTHEDERNNLIYNLENVITSEQGLQGKEDAILIEVGSVAIFLRDTQSMSEEALHTYSVNDQRNILINQLHMWTDDPISELEAKSSTDLLVIGCAFNSNLYLVAE